MEANEISGTFFFQFENGKIDKVHISDVFVEFVNKIPFYFRKSNPDIELVRAQHEKQAVIFFMQKKNMFKKHD